MKKSEAKILIFLNQVNIRYKYAKYMAMKLRIDYAYLLEIIHIMEDKKWLRTIHSANRIMYELTTEAPVRSAVKLWHGINKKRTLEMLKK